MILEREQINRYMRHIIMPEISGPGQKKLLESSVYIYGDTVKDISPMVYYFAACGIGSIHCCIKNIEGYETLSSNIFDLNSDAAIELVDLETWIGNKDSGRVEGQVFRVLLCDYASIHNNLSLFSLICKRANFVPTILSLWNGWKSIIKSFTTIEEFELFLLMFPNTDKGLVQRSNKLDSDKSGRILSTSVLGVLTVTESINLCLNLAEASSNRMLYVDILTCELYRPKLSESGTYVNKLFENEFYENSADSVKENDILSTSKVLIIGTGGLGSPSAYALAMAGVGTIGLVDYDKVDISNLNRQILHSASRIGMRKVDSAEIFLKQINPDIKLIKYNKVFNKNNALELIKDYDVIVDAVDNLEARYLLNDACYLLKKPMVEAGVLRFEGLCTTIIPGEGPCYRCIFNDMPKTGSIPSCSETGVLGSVPGIMGFIQAAEVIKLLLKKGSILKDKLLILDAVYLDISIVNAEKKQKCSLCGIKPAIIGLDA